jgi:predicted PurR-regulated permease PerM
MLSEGPLRTEIATTPSRADGLVNAVGSSILAAMIIAALYFGRDIFVPMALAILLTFVLAPAVHGLQGIHVPRSIAAVGVVLCAFACILALGSLFATQLNDLAGELPKYQTTISQKIQSLRSTTAGRGTLERASDMLKNLREELDKPEATPRQLPPGRTPLAPSVSAAPVPVEIKQRDPSALENLQTVISPLLHPLVTTGIIIVFVIFILIQREDLRTG